MSRQKGLIQKTKKDSGLSFKTGLIMFLFASLFVIVVLPPFVSQIITRTASYEEITIVNRANPETGTASMTIWGAGAGGRAGFGSFFGSSWETVLPHDSYFHVLNFPDGLGEVLHTNVPEASIALRLPRLPQTWVSFWPEQGMGSYVVIVGGNEYVVNLERAFGFYPFLQDSRLTAMYTALYMGIYVISAVLLYFIAIFIWRVKRAGVFSDDNPKRSQKYRWVYPFVAVFAVLMLFNLYAYHSRDHSSTFYPGYPGGVGDAHFYWHVGYNIAAIAAATENSFMATFAAYSPSFRGYLFPLVTYFMRVIAAGNVDFAYYLYFVLSSLSGAVFLALIVPALYKQLSGKEPRNAQVFVFSFIFLFFWRYYFYYIMPDFFSLLTLCAFMYFLIKYLRNPDWKTALFCGFVLSASISMRQNIQVFGIFFLAVSVILTLFRLFHHVPAIKNCLEAFQKKPGNISGLASYCLSLKGVALFFCGFVLVALPEIIINYHRGVVSLFAPDLPGSWTSPYQTLTIYGATTAFQNMQGHPWHLSNPLGAAIFTGVFGHIDTFTVRAADLAYLVMTYPREFFSTIVVRFFLLFDIKIVPLYVNPNNAMHPIFSTYAIVASLFNHLLISCALGSLLIKKVRVAVYNRKEAVILGIMLVFWGLLQSVVHVEWRYILPLYAMVYYCVAYRLYDYFFVQKDASGIGNYFAGAVFALTVIFTAISNVLYASLVF